LQANSTADLYDNVSLMERKMRELPTIQDVNSNLQINTPQINVNIDRKQAAARNVTVAQIETALGEVFGSRQISTIYTPTNEYQVILEAKPEFQKDPAAMGRLYIRSSTGILVPLSAVAKFSLGVGPALVNHFAELPATTISFNLRPGVSLSQATQQIKLLPVNRCPRRSLPVFKVPRRSFNHRYKPEVVAAGCRTGDLPRAGDSLRKFHSSLDDPVGSAVGGSGSAVDFAHLPTRVGHLCFRWLDSC